MAGWIRFCGSQKYGDCTETSRQQWFSFQPEGRGCPGKPPIFGEGFVVYEAVVPGVGNLDLQSIESRPEGMGNDCLKRGSPDRTAVDSIDANRGDIMEAVESKGGRPGSDCFRQFELIDVNGSACIVSDGIIWMGRPTVELIEDLRMDWSSLRWVKVDRPGT